ncbi:SDR family oxidoreductase [Winogradskyella forsetii]|uniref:SDR family oxidoreductase n=1 Tax=Winogradskyella forsetii TaxID=2686077 RepID=UPI0015BB0723|nr:SDR family oxidoreductase [Winogradskyella forsetii]
MSKPKEFPKQSQDQPGKQNEMNPKPEIIRADYKGSDKLKGKIALITGGDSGIGRSVAVHFAREGADVAIVYLSETEDAKKTKTLVEKEGQSCLLIKADLKKRNDCERVIKECMDTYIKLNILVNNAGVQFPKDSIEDVSMDDFDATYKTNIYPYFHLAKLSLAHLNSGDCIINTSSVTAYRGSSHLVDYASTKGAITSFTRSLAKQIADKNLRVNGVAPGPIWTPLIPATFDDVSDFGQDTPLGRAGQPSEVAPAYVFLASKDASYITGQFIHVNGGEIIGA